MYSLLLVLGVALVILSPLALELFLTAQERRRQLLEAKRFAALTNATGTSLPWIPARARW